MPIQPAPRPSLCVAPAISALPRFNRELAPMTFTGAQVEQRVGEYVCDVVADKDAKPSLAIEIFQTHDVSDAKGAALALHWIELEAAEVLENPYHWKPRQFRLKPVMCDECKEQIRKTRALAAKWNLSHTDGSFLWNPDRADYLAAAATCWQCHEYYVRAFPFLDRPVCKANT